MEHRETGVLRFGFPINLSMVKYTIMYTPKEGRGYNPR